VFLSDRVEDVVVEIQLRTIAMDFWASLEHKIYYKYDKQIPQELLDGLTDAAHTASELDARMERLHREVHGVPRLPHANRDIAV
jgi:GTP pyrophosphokinase